jgi:hypothetical protein
MMIEKWRDYFNFNDPRLLLDLENVHYLICYRQITMCSRTVGQYY